MLDREEYIEQAYLFHALGERLRQNMATQDLLKWIKEEILATTNLPMAMDYMAGELKLTGMFSPAMAKLPHYFTPFQTYVIAESEDPRSKFDFAVALKILEREAEYRAGTPTPQAIFLYQFERCAAIGLNTIAGWTPWPAIRFSTTPGRNGYSRCGARWG